MKTGVEVYTDEEGHQHYHFIFDKEHMGALKDASVWTEKEQRAWEYIEPLPDDDFFKKAFTFSIMLKLLHNYTFLPRTVEDVSPSSFEGGK
jgi:hypothetical protein